MELRVTAKAQVKTEAVIVRGSATKERPTLYWTEGCLRAKAHQLTSNLRKEEA